MDDELKKRMKGLSDEGLLDLIERDQAAYTPEALAFAKAEAEARGGLARLRQSISNKHNAELTSQSELERDHKPEVVSKNHSPTDRNDLLAQRIKSKPAMELLSMLAKYQQFPEQTLELVRAEVQERGGVEALRAEVESAGDQVPSIPAESLQKRKPVPAPQPKVAAPTVLGFLDGVRTIKEETIWEQWHQLVDHAAGHGPSVRQRIMDLLAEAEIPGGCTWEVEEVKSSTWISRVRREFLIVDLDQFPDWHQYIGVRDYGIHLDCCRFLTTEPGMVKGWLSAKLAEGDREALSKPRNVLVAQDLAAWRAVVNSAVLQAVKELMAKLGQDVSLLQRKSKGILDVW